MSCRRTLPFTTACGLALFLSVALASDVAAAGPTAAGNTGQEKARKTDQPLRVMSFNIWGGGLNEGRGVEDTVAALRAADADIIGLQEVSAEGTECAAEDCPPAGETVTRKIAEALDYHWLEQTKVSEANWNNAILSRYPIRSETPMGLGAAIDVDGATVYLFNVHLTDYPYQPYQLLGIEYGAAPFIDSAAQAVEQARAAREPGLEVLRRDLESIDPDAVVFVTGDFNEPSHRDWTAAAASAGYHPLAVAYPTILRLEEMGFEDLMRVAFPDEVAHPAFTWTPRPPEDDAAEHHDRIDYVLARGPGIVVEKVEIVGEQRPQADIVSTPWPSDHRAVVATVRLD